MIRSRAKVSEMTDKPRNIKVALVGLQHLHPKGYLTLFRGCPRTEVTCVYDPDQAILAGFCADSGLKGYTDLEGMLADQRPDMAAIFLPHADCADAAIQCARRGLHLMVEKPIADTAEGAQRVVDAAAECNVKLTTGYCWRYHPVVKAMKDIVAQGLIGRVVSVEARLAAGRVDRYIAGHSAWMLKKAQSGGGPLLNLGVHWLDLIGHVTGQPVEAVCAVNTHTSDAYDVETSSVVLLRFASGAAGVLSTSYLVPDCFPGGRDLYIGLRGTEGVMSYHPRYEGEQASGAAPPTDVLELFSSAPALAGASARQFHFRLDPVPGYSGYMGQAYVDGFADAILEDRDPDITGREAVSVLRVVEAVYASDANKQWMEVQP